MKTWKQNIFGIVAIIVLTFGLIVCDNGNPESEPKPEPYYGIKYPSYTGLVMAGYQGWFNVPTDGANRGWVHYGFNNNNSLNTPPTEASIDFWPDMTEYTKKYNAPFQMYNGGQAYCYSSYDEESVDLHFKWMRDFGIDGVFMQRFVTEINNESGKNHFNKVLSSALKAARKYERAIGVMYDLSGCQPGDLNTLISDWVELKKHFSLSNPDVNPYIHHNGKPLLTIWGVGFNDNRHYTTVDVQSAVIKLRNDHGVSIMLGVPYWWRSMSGDTENNPAFHTLIKNYADIVMPWAVGRYDNDAYGQGTHDAVIPGDIQWCAENNVDYVPLVFPGFSWGNLVKNPTKYNEIPRYGGDFLWKQIAGAKTKGAKSLYVAMFDEIDEGTAIFKCTVEPNLPVWTDTNKKFVGIEQGLASDYYLWLVGEGAKWFHGGTGYSHTKPTR